MSTIVPIGAQRSVTESTSANSKVNASSSWFSAVVRLFRWSPPPPDNALLEEHTPLLANNAKQIKPTTEEPVVFRKATDLPVEVWGEIFLCCQYMAAYQLSTTCKTLRDMFLKHYVVKYSTVFHTIQKITKIPALTRCLSQQKQLREAASTSTSSSYSNLYVVVSGTCTVNSDQEPFVVRITSLTTIQYSGLNGGTITRTLSELKDLLLNHHDDPLFTAVPPSIVACATVETVKALFEKLTTEERAAIQLASGLQISDNMRTIYNAVIEKQNMINVDKRRCTARLTSLYVALIFMGAIGLIIFILWALATCEFTGQPCPLPNNSTNNNHYIPRRD